MKSPEEVLIRDHGLVLAISFEACRLYHGEDSIGGLALGFRLVQFALAELSPGAIASREDIRLRTAFPGPGLLDAVEMTTRAVSRDAVEVLHEAPKTAPEAVYGRLYFEISLQGRTLCCEARPGAMSEDFIRTGRAVKAGGRDPELLRHWKSVKEALAAAVLAASPSELFVIRNRDAA